MKTVFKIMLGVTFALLLVIGGCTALVGTAVNEGVKSVEEDNAKSAITTEQYDQISTGMTKEEVLQIAAPAVPSDEQETEIDTGDTGIDANSNCIYFNKKDGEMLDMYQFCFDGSGVLDSKSSF